MLEESEGTKNRSDPQQLHEEQTGNKRKPKYHNASSSKLFPAFVPDRVKHYHIYKKTWKPISSSSRSILEMFTKRAKSACLAMTPDGRRDEVIQLLNRIMTSAFIKIDERLYPKSGIDADSYDVVSLETMLENQKKQNSLLQNSAGSIQRELESEEASVKRLEDEKSSLLARINELKSDSSLKRQRADDSESIGSEEELAVKRHRHAFVSAWRRRSEGDSLASSTWWSDVKEAVNERIESEKPIRKVVKRMAEIDTKLNSLFSDFRFCYKHTTATTSTALQSSYVCRHARYE